MKGSLIIVGLVAAVFGVFLYAGDVGISVSDSSITHTMLNPLVEKCTNRTLTSSEMDALNATPITLVSAPGTSYAYQVTGVYAIARNGGTAFELGSGTLGVNYTNASGSAVVAVIPNATVETATQSVYHAIPVSVTVADTAALVATASADVTAGTGTVTIRVCYKTVPTLYSNLQ